MSITINKLFSKIHITVGIFGLLMGLSFNTSAVEQNAKHDRYMVNFKPGHVAQAKQALAARGGKVKLEIPNRNILAVNLPAQAISHLSNNPNITFIEKDPEKEFFLQEVPYAIPMIQADLLSDNLTANQKICIIDSGLDITHEDIVGSNYDGLGSWYEDSNGHGTYMASAIIAANNNTGVVGVAPNGHINIFMMSIWERYASNYIKALDNCQAAGATVVTISAGNATESKNEAKAFREAYENGLLIMAAAGNDGDTTQHYPSGYPEVISVGAVDRYKRHAPYSVQNESIELVAPGSAVLGTWSTQTDKEVRQANMTVDGVFYDVTPTLQSPNSSTTGPLMDCGTGQSVCTNATGSVCIINATQDNDVTDEVLNCEAGGGIGAILYADEFNIAYGEGIVTEAATNIPSINVSDYEATQLKNQLGATVSLETFDSVYKRAFGTSMSTPFVAAVGALVWSYHPECSNQEVRNALVETAEDHGATGRDNYFGYGLVQAADAKAYLDANPCGSTPPAGDEILLTANGYKEKGARFVNLTWQGSTGSDVDIYRNSQLITTTSNDGDYTEAVDRGTYTYKVCETGTSTCSNQVNVTP